MLSRAGKGTADTPDVEMHGVVPSQPSDSADTLAFDNPVLDRKE